jgi:hypothetical protein
VLAAPLFSESRYSHANASFLRGDNEACTGVYVIACGPVRTNNYPFSFITQLTRLTLSFGTGALVSSFFLWLKPSELRFPLSQFRDRTFSIMSTLCCRAVVCDERRRKLHYTKGEECSDWRSITSPRGISPTFRFHKMLGNSWAAERLASSPEGLRSMELVKFRAEMILSYTHTRTHTQIYIYKKLLGLSPRANYTDRATGACRRSDCQLVLIEGATWSAWRIPPAVFSVF